MLIMALTKKVARPYEYLLGALLLARPIMENEKKEEKAKKSKRYYWYKLYETFFSYGKIKTIKKKYTTLYVGVYLEIITLAINTNGCIQYEDCYADIEEQIADFIDEDYDLVKKVVETFTKYNFIKRTENGLILLNIDEFVGSETDYAKQKRLQRQSKDNVHNMSTDIEKEQDIDLNVDKERELEKASNSFVYYGKHKRVGLTTKQYNMLLKSMGEANLKLRIDLLDEDLNDGLVFNESSIVDMIRNYKLPTEVVRQATPNQTSKFLLELQDNDELPPF